MNKTELMQFANTHFKDQMGLELSDILTLENDKFSITSDNKLGLSMASIRLDLSDDEHGIMADFLTAVSDDNSIESYMQ